MRRSAIELIETDIRQSPALPGFLFFVTRADDRVASRLSHFYP
jgi:hypothetical protein